MIYKEEQRDLFNVPKSYTLCHCISSDFAMGAGIAKEFARRGIREQLIQTGLKDVWGDQGYAFITNVTDYNEEINLITKQHYWDKPTNKSLEESLRVAKRLIEIQPHHISQIAMPRIGCGLDKLKWEEVSAIIQNVFKDTDMEILVCIK